MSKAEKIVGNTAVEDLPDLLSECVRACTDEDLYSVLSRELTLGQVQEIEAMIQDRASR